MNPIAAHLDGRKKVVGVGNALIDTLIHESDAFVASTGFSKGGMILVDHAFMQKYLSRTTAEPAVVPGGSACNMTIGMGRLGGAVCFVGKCGQGEQGRLFASALKKNNVDPVLFTSGSHTGRCLSIITPDAQRSMFTYLGAAAEMRPEDISTRFFKDAAVVHIEGYLLFNRVLILAALKAAKSAGASVSLDLGSLQVVEESQDILPALVEDYVDILIANEDEARAFTGHADEIKALNRLSQKVQIAVLNVGEHGSYIRHAEKQIHIAAAGAGAVVDTTGAGDLWTSGFLFGLVNDYPLPRCGELGALCGYEVCQVLGADIPQEGWKKINHFLEEQWPQKKE